MQSDIPYPSSPTLHYMTKGCRLLVSRDGITWEHSPMVQLADAIHNEPPLENVPPVYHADAWNIRPPCVETS